MLIIQWFEYSIIKMIDFMSKETTSQLDLVKLVPKQKDRYQIWYFTEDLFDLTLYNMFHHFNYYPPLFLQGRMRDLMQQLQRDLQIPDDDDEEYDSDER